MAGLLNNLRNARTSVFTPEDDVTLQGDDGYQVAILQADCAVESAENFLNDVEADEGLTSFYIEEGLDEVACLQSEITEALNNGGLTPLEFQLASRLIEKAGLSGEFDLPALQSFSGSDSRLSATNAILHGIKDQLQNAATTVKKFILKVIDKITRLMSKLFTAGGRIGAKAKKIEAKAAKMGSELRDSSAKLTVPSDLLSGKTDKLETDLVTKTKVTVALLETGIPAEQERGEKFIKALETANDAGASGASALESAINTAFAKAGGAKYSSSKDDGLSTANAEVFPQDALGLGSWALAIEVGTTASNQDDDQLDDDGNPITPPAKPEEATYTASATMKAGAKTKVRYMRCIKKDDIPNKAAEIKPYSQSDIQGAAGEIKECSRLYDNIRTKSVSLTREMKALANTITKNAGSADGNDKQFLNAVVKISNNAVSGFISGYMSAAVGSAKRLNAVLNLCDKSIGMYKKA